MTRLLIFAIAALLSFPSLYAQNDGSKRKPKPAAAGQTPQKKKDKGEKVNSNVRKQEPAGRPLSLILKELDESMVFVKGGTFSMGATPEQESRVSNDKPSHRVTIDSYYICKYEVTQELWKAVMGRNPSNYSGNRLPVECVSWEDTQTFIAKLNSLSGKTFRLPTEAEWEFAARGGNNSRGYKYSGSNDIDEVAWYKGNSNYSTHNVGEKKPNELGLYDMNGNVAEWCSDWYDQYSEDAQTNPKGPASGTKRAYRGNCYSDEAEFLRISSRIGGEPDKRYGNYGFRLAISDNISESLSTEPAISVSSYTPIVNTYSINGVSFQMVEVKGGTFVMGATPEQGNDARDNEKPLHSVTLDSYFIGKCEVTQDLWVAVMGISPSLYWIKKGSQVPVSSIKWSECETFINRLNALTGSKFRLPTEAEWEFAARGGNNTKGYKYSGSNNIDDVAWYKGNSGATLHEVGKKSPNELGLYDMSGNVGEWCYDLSGYYSSEAQTNPTGATSGSYRIWRGGYTDTAAENCRVSLRGRSTDSRASNIGFRLVLSE